MAIERERVDCAWVGVEARAEVHGEASVVGGDDRYHVHLIAPTLEQAEVLREFGHMLAGTSRDGGRKRAAGVKPSWKVDQSHMPAIYSHLS